MLNLFLFITACNYYSSEPSLSIVRLLQKLPTCLLFSILAPSLILSHNQTDLFEDKSHHVTTTLLKTPWCLPLHFPWLTSPCLSSNLITSHIPLDYNVPSYITPLCQLLDHFLVQNLGPWQLLLPRAYFCIFTWLAASHILGLSLNYISLEKLA